MKLRFFNKKKNEEQVVVEENNERVDDAQALLSEELKESERVIKANVENFGKEESRVMPSYRRQLKNLANKDNTDLTIIFSNDESNEK